MFQKAQPVWAENRERDMNIHAVWQTEIAAGSGLELHIAGTAFYRIYVNGRFLGFGPARAAESYVREDIFSLDAFAKDSICTVVIETVGYYCKSLSTVLQPSYIMAELQKDGQVLSYTGRDFACYLPGCKVQKAERYSIQRHFTEVWDFRTCRSLTDAAAKTSWAVLPLVPQVLPRRAPYPLYEEIDLDAVACWGTYTFDETLPYREVAYSWKEVPYAWGVFPQEEIAYHPFAWIQRQKKTPVELQKKLPIVLEKGMYAIFDFGRIEAGFLKASIESLQESDVVIGFSELYLGTEFQFTKMNAHNAVEYFLSEGSKETLSFEPYTFRYAILLVKEGRIKLNSFGVKTYMFDISNVDSPKGNNAVQTAICDAAVRTFAHNAVDIYMDCPSRERAGWLCDSYFTARTEYALTGKTLVEDAFLENYRLYRGGRELPMGALPECYPADVPLNGEFIPQWTMWYILEVEEYILKRGHGDMREAFRKSIYGLLDFYRRYENADGLLECLPSWNFVEWSKANSWTWDVNYPTNFLYSRVLEAIYNLYGDEQCQKRCKEVRETAIFQSFNGKYFLDHSVRDVEGVLRIQEDSSEACQYYAVLFADIDIESDKFHYLKSLILSVFTPERNGIMPEIMEVNAFIGAYLRMDVLLKMQAYDLLLKDVEGFFGQMSAYTGTLWEFRQFNGSYDHGFASYALVSIQEALKRSKI